MSCDPWLFSGDGEIVKLLREYDWSNTPIGPPDTWPPVYRTALRMTLDCAIPMNLFLGPELAFFYNDANIPLMHIGHPAWLGRSFPAMNPASWERINRRLIAAVRRTNRGVSGETFSGGVLQERYFNFALSPLRDDRGEIVGFYAPLMEITARVVAERRLDLMQRLLADGFAAEAPEQTCRAAAEVLAGAPDLPVSALYYVYASERKAVLVGASGLTEEGRVRLPQTVMLGTDEPDPLRIDELVRSRQTLALPDFAATFGPMLCEPSLARSEALALPIPAPDTAHLAAVLVALPTPLRPAAEVRGFLELVVRQLAAALSNAQSKQNAHQRARELAELDRAKTVFLGNVSHELRTPLTLLSGPLQHVLESATLGQAERAYLETAQRAAGRLHKLVNGLLDFARVEAGRMNLSFLPTRLSELTNELASMFRSAFDDAGLAFVVDAAELQEPVHVDPALWEKIVLNLLSNALKYTLSGQVRLALSTRGEEVLLEVSDTGCGIAPDELPRIFERFYRAHAPAARSQEGSGIGLSLVRELARLHGGEVEMESALGAGTTVRVRVPRGTAHADAQCTTERPAASARSDLAGLFRQEALGWLRDPTLAGAEPRREPRALERLQSDAVEQAEPAGPRARILVVDDNADMRGYLRRILEQKWSVATAADGASALLAASAEPPDLLLTDVTMPGLDGFNLLAALRAEPRTSALPVILLSARAGEEASVQALSAGARDYIVKPFSPRELVARVDAQLARAEAECAERRARELAEQASLAKERFLAVLSHELRNPLSFITGWTGMLRAGTLDAAQAAHAHEIIDHSAQLMQRVMEDLLDVSRIVAGRLTIAPSFVETLAPRLRSLVSALQPKAAQKGIKLLAEIEERAGPIDGDVERLDQVVLNLIGNALKFTPTGGQIAVWCRRRGTELELIVRDTGTGISAAALPHLFDAFWMGEQTGGRAAGLGLGLAIARSIASLHGGTLIAQSEGEGKGATFVLRLPLAHEEGNSAHRSVDDEAPADRGPAN